MDNNIVGQAITYLRKKAGYTQSDLADRLGITDKAVSKWERGLSLPDISILGKLSVLLDIDTESLLAGDVGEHRMDWCGFLYLKENSENIGLDTIIFDKPLVYFLFGYFLLMGIKNIVVLSSPEDKIYLEEHFPNENNLGINLKVYTGDVKEVVNKFPFTCSNVMTVLDRTIIYGVDQSRFFSRAMANKNNITLLSLPKNNSQATKLLFDENRKIVQLDNEDVISTQYDYFEIPIVFSPLSKLGSVVLRNEDFDKNNEPLYTELLDRGFVVINVEDAESVSDASNFVRIVQKQCDMQLYALEEIAWRRGLISHDELLDAAKKYKDSTYGNYLKNLR